MSSILGCLWPHAICIAATDFLARLRGAKNFEEGEPGDGVACLGAHQFVQVLARQVQHGHITTSIVLEKLHVPHHGYLVGRAPQLLHDHRLEEVVQSVGAGCKYSLCVSDHPVGYLVGTSEILLN